MPIELPAVRILIVDDDKQILDYMQTLLENDGFQVKALIDPTLVEAEVRSGDYHVIILDLMMPEMDGFAVMAALAERRINIPTIMITAPLTGALRRQAEKAGAFSILENPLSDGVLLQNILHAVT